MKTALPLQQHPRFAAAIGLLGRPVVQIPVQGSAPVVAVPVFKQLIAARGPVWHGDACADALRASGLRIVTPDRPDRVALRSAGFRQIHTAASVAELTLTPDTGAVMTRLHGKWRNTWRRAQNAPVMIKQERFTAQQHGWLLENDSAQQRIKRYRALPHRVIHAFAATQRSAAIVFVAYHEQTPVSAMLFLHHAPVVTYHLGWNGALGRKWGLHQRLLMAAAAHFAQRGLTRMDLGGVETDTAPGLARFKIGTGATVRPLGGTWLRFPV